MQNVWGVGAASTTCKPMHEKINSTTHFICLPKLDLINLGSNVAVIPLLEDWSPSIQVTGALPAGTKQADGLAPAAWILQHLDVNSMSSFKLKGSWRFR
jgi:hypothetical protein